MKHLTLLDGGQMPALGMGTFEMEGADCAAAVSDALAIGYRHIDTAQMYGNEEWVGRGIRESGVRRPEIFLTTKIWWENLDHSSVLASTYESLRRLDTDHVDLLLIHWPTDEVDLAEPLAALTVLKEQGKTRHIGVSNFTPTLVRKALEEAPICCNQVEYHPFLGQEELRELLRQRGLALVAYSPLARGRVADNEQLRRIGERHGKSAAQVTLRWLLQQEGVAAIPKAASPEHRRSNFRVFDFELSEEEMLEISSLARGERLIDPEFAPAWGS